MKKNLLKIMFVALIGVAMGYNVYNSQTETDLSDLVLANVEALARDESGTIDCSNFNFKCCYTEWTFCSNAFYSICHGSVTIVVDPSC